MKREEKKQQQNERKIHTQIDFTAKFRFHLWNYTEPVMVCL